MLLKNQNVMRSSGLFLNQKVLACYPHVYTSSIARMIGCDKSYPYEVLKCVGLRPITKVTTISKRTRKSDRWNDEFL